MKQIITEKKVTPKKVVITTTKPYLLEGTVIGIGTKLVVESTDIYDEFVPPPASSDASMPNTNVDIYTMDKGIAEEDEMKEFEDFKAFRKMKAMKAVPKAMDTEPVIEGEGEYQEEDDGVEIEDENELEAMQRMARIRRLRRMRAMQRMDKQEEEDEEDKE